MKKNGVFSLLRLWISGVYLCFSAMHLLHTDATKTIHYYRAGEHFKSSSETKLHRKIHALVRFDMDMPLDASNTNPYVSSPFSLPPYDSLSPLSQPQNTPPFCVYPPPIPQPPSTKPTPVGAYSPPPPPGPTPPPPSPSTPQGTPLTPPTTVPNPNPPAEPGLSPPNNNVPFPSGSVPSPRFLPPIVFPPPMVPPPPQRAQARTMWCVAKASVPDPIIQEAMNYACASGANCDQIQDNGPCFQPNTVFAHASYAFNSYWQITKRNGGRCDFGGTAVLVTVDPSYDGCHFIYL